jgi:anti-sigma B factor antagonist
MGWRVDLPRRDWRPPAEFSVSVGRTADGSPVVAATGELDVHTAPALVPALRAAATEGGSPVLLDLGGVTFVDSTTLHVIVDAARRLRAERRELVVVVPDRNVRKVFVLTGLDRVLPIVESYPASLLPA